MLLLDGILPPGLVLRFGLGSFLVKRAGGFGRTNSLARYSFDALGPGKRLDAFCSQSDYPPIRRSSASFVSTEGSSSEIVSILKAILERDGRKCQIFSAVVRSSP